MGENHIGWMYREACVRSHKDLRRGEIRGDWFELASMIEKLFPEEVDAFRVSIGADPIRTPPTGEE